MPSEILVQYGALGIMVLGLAYAVIKLDSRNERLIAENRKITIDTMNSDNDKFATLKQAIEVLQELRKSK